MPSVEKVGFAVVGLGSIAQTCVLPAFANAKYARLVALVGRDKKRALQLAHRFKAQAAYGAQEYDKCLANPDVLAVYVATPNADHADQTIRAAAAGKHVLCEKPLAATVKQSKRMLEAHRRGGTLLMTAYRKYFEPSCVFFKQLLDRGELGRIDVIHTAFNELHTPSVSPAWLLDRKVAGGGPLMDLGVYCINTTRWLIREDPVRATAFSWTHDRTKFQSIEEGIEFRLEFPSGVIVHASTTYSSAISSFISIQGTGGWLLLTQAFPFDQERKLIGKIGSRSIDRTFKIVDEFAPELDHFAQAIRGKQVVEPDGAQGHRDMLIIQAIYQSARARKPVTIRYN